MECGQCRKELPNLAEQVLGSPWVGSTLCAEAHGVAALCSLKACAIQPNANANITEHEAEVSFGQSSLRTGANSFPIKFRSNAQIC